MPQSKDDPPNVPSGWKAVFDDEYQTWFYVYLATKRSQWEEPEGTTWNKISKPPMPPPSYKSKEEYSRGSVSPPHSARRAQPAPPPQTTYRSQPPAPVSPQPYYSPQVPQQQPMPMYPPQQPMPMPMYAPQQPVYGGAPMPQPVYQQAPVAQQKSSSGVGKKAFFGSLAGAGVGVLGAEAISHAFDHHHDQDTTIVENNYYDNGPGGYDNGYGGGGGYDNGYDQGYNDGFDDGNYDGGDGGDW